jgi:hypothetical protein
METGRIAAGEGTMAAAKNRERIANNFVERYGADRLRRLLEALANGESGEAIAQEFGVSRERVRQWKNAFGTIVTLYQIHPDVQRVAEELSRR